MKAQRVDSRKDQKQRDSQHNERLKELEKQVDPETVKVGYESFEQYKGAIKRLANL